MPTTEELASINPGDAITAAYLSRFAMEINLLRREVDELKRERDGGCVVESVPVELTGLETDGIAVYTGKTIVRGLPDIASVEPDIDSLGDAAEENDSVVWNLAAIENSVLGRYIGTREDGKQVFIIPSIPAALVKATSAASGGGKYNGSRWVTPSTALAATGNLSEAELGIAGDDCLIYNAAEVGQSTHDLTTGTPIAKIFPAIFLGYTSAMLPVYGINGQDWENCT